MKSQGEPSMGFGPGMGTGMGTGEGNDPVLVVQGQSPGGVGAAGEGAGSHNTQTEGAGHAAANPPAPGASPRLAGDVRTPLVTSRSGPAGFHARAALSWSGLWRRAKMKPLTSKQSPPKLLGACAPPRGALVAMDAAAAAARPARRVEGSRGRRVAGSRGLLLGHLIQGSRGVGPSSQAGGHHEVHEEGVSPQDHSKQILGGRRELERLALAASGAQQTLAGAGVLGGWG